MSYNNELSTEIDLLNIPGYEEKTHLQRFVICVLDSDLVKDFYISPASLTGKHHPADEHGPGGLVLHTKRTVKLFHQLSGSLEIPPEQRQYGIAALILHDIYRPLGGLHKELHHLVPRIETFKYIGALRFDIWNRVMTLIEGHAGFYTIPKTLFNHEDRTMYLVHVADLIASRSNIKVEVGTKED